MGVFVPFFAKSRQNGVYEMKTFTDLTMICSDSVFLGRGSRQCSDGFETETAAARGVRRQIWAKVGRADGCAARSVRREGARMGAVFPIDGCAVWVVRRTVGDAGPYGFGRRWGVRTDVRCEAFGGRVQDPPLRMGAVFPQTDVRCGVFGGGFGGRWRIDGCTVQILTKTKTSIHHRFPCVYRRYFLIK